MCCECWGLAILASGNTEYSLVPILASANSARNTENQRGIERNTEKFREQNREIERNQTREI
jgi:hypothetical protein